jgi:5S rRNA maturation endonuclease (ribonuclease M5)
MNRRNAITGMLAGATVLAGKSFAQTTTASPKSPNIALIVEQNAKQIMLLMDADKDGKISKHEWLDFMSTEFDRLDTDHNGNINQKELMATQIRIQHVNPAVVGK